MISKGKELTLEGLNLAWCLKQKKNSPKVCFLKLLVTLQAQSHVPGQKYKQQLFQSFLKEPIYFCFVSLYSHYFHFKTNPYSILQKRRKKQLFGAGRRSYTCLIFGCISASPFESTFQVPVIGLTPPKPFYSHLTTSKDTIL